MKKDNKIAILSDYSWVYLSSNIIKKLFPDSNITLITRNTNEFLKEHDFSIDVIRLKKSEKKEIKSLKSMNFQTGIIDYGFNLHIIFLVFSLDFKELFIIDMRKSDILQPINKLDFIKIIINKFPYFFNKMLTILSQKLRLSRNLALPSELYIETTNTCNLKCRGCPTGLGKLKKQSIMMNKDSFESIIKNNIEIFPFLEYIVPFFYGEPLLNKYIFQYINCLRDLSYPYTLIEIHTNGNIIGSSKEIAKKLLETNIDIISISLDGPDKESYESFRNGGNFDIVYTFIKDLTSLKKEMKLFRPEIVIQMILTKYNEDKVEDFIKLKEELGVDRVVFKPFISEFTELSYEETNCLIPNNQQFILGKEQKQEFIKNKKNLCGWLYRAFCILVDNSITPCCIDPNGSLLNGLNLKNTTIKKVWNSPKYKQLRKLVLKGKVKLCNNCFFS